MDRLDYSRFDHLECSDEEGDSYGDGAVARPTVTRLDAPSSVTFGGADNVQRAGKSRAASASSSASSSASASTLGSRGVCASMIMNGARTPTHWWCQTRTDVTVRFVVAGGVRARDVRLRVEERALCFSIKGEDQLAHGSALHLPVKPVADILDIDWEIERDVVTDDSTSRLVFVRVTMEKKTVSGVIMWWDRIFQAEMSQVDVTAIADRGKTSQSVVTGQGNSTSSSSQKVWEEAHALFRERVKTRQQQAPQKI